MQLALVIPDTDAYVQVLTDERVSLVVREFFEYNIDFQDGIERVEVRRYEIRVHYAPHILSGEDVVAELRSALTDDVLLWSWNINPVDVVLVAALRNSED